MRITFIQPTECEFKSLFLSTPLRKGGGIEDINIFQPKYPSLLRKSRRGGGIFSFLTKRVLPFIFKAAKPSAKTFVSSVLNDLTTGKRPIKESLKKHGIQALKDTGRNLISGSGKVVRRRRRRRNKSYLQSIKKIDKKKKKKMMRHQYKSNIFDGI